MPGQKGSAGNGKQGSTAIAIVLIAVGVIIGVIGVAYYFYYYYGVSGPYAPSGTGEYVIAKVPRIMVVSVEPRGYYRGLDYRVDITATLENLGDRGCYANVYLYCTCGDKHYWTYDYVYVPPRGYAYAHGDVDATIWSECKCGAKVVSISCP